MSSTILNRKNYSVEIESPEIYVDNESRKRSGHMTHAMAEFAPGCFIDFNSNCSAVRWCGHSPYGWVEYRISRDAGKTYSDAKILPYSMDCFLDGVKTISVEKAVACDDGTIVAFCLRNDALGPTCCEPFDTPYVVTSNDEGETWNEAYELCKYEGRVYDAIYHKGAIYVTMFCYKHFIGHQPEHVYRIYKSTDNGKSFKEHCIVPIDGNQRAYSAMMLDKDERLHYYAYNLSDECNMDHVVSDDMGETWTICEPCYVAKGIRNPQMKLVDGVYILHGRAKDFKGFVLYTSEDAQNWDEGHFVVENEGGVCYYSNNIVLNDEKGPFLLMQYSDTYNKLGEPESKQPGYMRARVNVIHQKIRIIR